MRYFYFKYTDFCPSGNEKLHFDKEILRMMELVRVFRIRSFSMVTKPNRKEETREKEGMLSQRKKQLKIRKKMTKEELKNQSQQIRDRETIIPSLSSFFLKEEYSHFSLISILFLRTISMKWKQLCFIVRIEIMTI